MDPKEIQPEAGTQPQQPVVEPTTAVQPEPVDVAAASSAVADAHTSAEQTSSSVAPQEGQMATGALSDSIEAVDTQAVPGAAPAASTPDVVQPQPNKQPQQQNMGAFGDVSHGKGKMFKKILAIVVAVAAVAFVAFMVMKLLSGGGKIDALAADTKNGVSFMRPENWVETKEEDGLIFYTEEGKDVDSVDLGLILSAQDIGIRYSSLSEDDKSNVEKSFEAEFSGEESLGNDQCEDVEGITSGKVDRDDYDLAFEVEATCAKLVDADVGGIIKMLIGWSDANIHVVGVVADTDTWDGEGSELDAILTSVKPE